MRTTRRLRRTPREHFFVQLGVRRGHWLWSRRTGTHRYSAGGTYTIALHITDNANQTSYAIQTVTVVAPPPPTVHVGDLDGSRTAAQKSWSAKVTIGFHTENHGGAAGVTVTGVWDDGAAGTCTTDGIRPVLSEPGRHPAQNVERQVQGDWGDSFLVRVQPRRQSRS